MRSSAFSGLSKRLLIAVGVFAAAAVFADARISLAEEPLTGTLRTMDPRPVGLGGVLRASSSGTSGIYLNPATIAMTPLYHIEAMYQYTGEEQMHSGGVAVVDSITSIIAAGLSFNYSRIDRLKMDHEAYDVRLALAGGIGDLFRLGLTGRYLHLEQNLGGKNQGPAGVAALPYSGSQQVDGFTFDAGAAFRLGDLVTLGLVGYNLTDTGSVFAPLQIGGGLSLHLMSMLLIEGNLVVDFTSHDNVNEETHLGVELFIANQVAIRAGHIYDVYFNRHSISAGLGYVDSVFAIDFGFMQEIVADGRMILAFGFKYFIT